MWKILPCSKRVQVNPKYKYSLSKYNSSRKKYFNIVGICPIGNMLGMSVYHIYGICRFAKHFFQK